MPPLLGVHLFLMLICSATDILAHPDKITLTGEMLHAAAGRITLPYHGHVIIN